MKLHKFTKTRFLEQMGRPMLAGLLERFAADFAAHQLPMPGGELNDPAFYAALSHLALTTHGLPATVIEALYVIEVLGDENGMERVGRALARAGLAVHVHPDSTPAEVILQTWLAAPEVVMQQHREQRLNRLSTFQYFGSKTPRKAAVAPEEHPPVLNFEPRTETLLQLTDDMDKWFLENHRGEETAKIRVQLVRGECWFLVRHGHTFARTEKVIRRDSEILLFRPAREDVVVCSPERDEIRLHAGTQGEREMYRRALGHRLFGDPGYFSEKKAYTLQPLRDDGADALLPPDPTTIRRIILREVQVAWDAKGQELTTRKSNDVFGAPVPRGCEMERIPAGGDLVRAVFDVYFGNEFRPRKVEIRPPNVLKVGRHCDAQALQEWLSERGFRAVIPNSAAQKAA